MAPVVINYEAFSVENNVNSNNKKFTSVLGLCGSAQVGGHIIVL